MILRDGWISAANERLGNEKIEVDSKWHALPHEQREKVLHWLFDEGMSFAKALKRARKEFGVRASATSLRRFYHHVSEERHWVEMGLTPGSVEHFREAALKLLGVAALELATGGGHESDNVKRIVPMVKLLMKEKDQALIAARMDLVRDKFQAMAAARKGIKK